MNTTTNSASPADIVRRLLEEITLHPEQIKIEESRLGRSMTNLKIQVHAGDMSRVIGSKGTHARALSTLLDIISARLGMKITSRFIEPTTGQKDSYDQFSPAEKWNYANVLQITEDICAAVFEHPAKVEICDGDDYMSVVEIMVSPREKKELVTMVESCLTPLYNAIGKANGRHLKVNAAPGGF